MTCRVLKLARQPYYRWLANPVTDAEYLEAHRANALFDALPRPRRRPGFRSEVLHGWRNRCAMCGYDGALGRDPAGLDAAHVFTDSA